MSEDFDLSALNYHRLPVAGKLEVIATKPLATQRDLSLAYSPGVAAACNEIVADPAEASTLTARGNLVAVISNGTAVLGLGAIGPLAAKPVMEGKAVLFKKFSGIDVFDLEVDELDPDRFVDIVASLEPTFGAINLEDIKAPECFEIERKLRARMKIPVMHDDQHGTAIIVGAAVLNGLHLVGKDIREVRVVTSGAGAAALACLNHLVNLGLPREHITVTDIVGVVYEGRTEQMDPWKGVYAQATDARTLGEVIEGADVFLGLSAPRVLTGEMVSRMADRPIIMALANPTPEILPEEARAARADAIIATGRSDYPNQVNNVLCFPFIFRGALDVGATGINEEMKVAATRALAQLAQAGPSDLVSRAYGGKPETFGPEHIIPKPFDPRLMLMVAPAVARAAMESGVATRPIEDFDAYRERLTGFVFRSGMVMKPVFSRAKADPKRVVFAEGEDPRVLQAVRAVIDEGIAQPVLIGRPNVIQVRIRRLGLDMKAGKDFELVSVVKDRRFTPYWKMYHELAGRRGVSPEEAKSVMHSRPTAIGAMMVRCGEADAMICGTVGRFDSHLARVREVIGVGAGIRDLSTMTALVLPSGTFFICDTHVTPDPSAEELAEMTLLAAREVRAFGIQPKVALLSRSNFGTHGSPAAAKMREALSILRATDPSLEVDGEMHGDVALAEDLRRRALPTARLEGQANLLVMPNVEAAHIGYNLLKILGGGVAIGPILLGSAYPVHVVTQSITVRGLLNMVALCSIQAQDRVAAGSGGH